MKNKIDDCLMLEKSGIQSIYKTIQLSVKCTKQFLDHNGIIQL